MQFSVEFEKRANNIDRMKSINVFAELVKPPHKVNLNKPQKTILVNILKNTCGISVVNDYRDLGRFNIRALAGEGELTAAKEKSPTATADDADQAGA
jgi:tRNA acetyltransferase TAN1